MVRFVLLTSFGLLLVLASCDTTVFANVLIDQAVNVDNNLIGLDENDNLLVDDDYNSDHRTIDDDINKDNDNDSIMDEIDISNMDENTNDSIKFINRLKDNNKLTDILVACFFFVAAVWLILATVYSVILLILLRLQARDELDIYDENLGRVTLRNGLTLNFGCIVRRFAIQLEEDYNQHMQSRFGDSSSAENQVSRIRIMTREERRKAMGELLGGFAKTVCVASENTENIEDDSIVIDSAEDGCDMDIPTNLSLDVSLPSSEEGPVCSICLIEYEPTDLIFKSKSCPHMFHAECLLSWLERRNNTECPCCREVLVSDEDVWNVVQRMRKERRKRLRKENGFVRRLIKWVASKREQHLSCHGDRNSITSISSGSNDENLDQESAEVVDTTSVELINTSDPTEQHNTDDDIIDNNNQDEEQQRDT